MTILKSLRLTDFRNYSALDLTFEPGPVVFYGANGSGKTNLLEAISFLSPGRGLRRAKVDAIARKDAGQTAPAWGVTVNLRCGGDEHKAAIGQVPEHPGRKTVRIDGRTGSGTELAELISLIWLTPEQDRLFGGGASDRRKFLDRLTLAHAPDHGRWVVRYEKARTERGRLLSDQVTDAHWYDALEADMSIAGSIIAHNRVKTLTQWQAEIERRPEGEFPKSVIDLDGEVESFAKDAGSEEATQVFFQSLLKDHRPIDQRAGRTLRGIHKSDLVVTHAAKQMPASACSTGEQKALLIGLILAQARAQADHSPVLLLDEVVAHLDVDRRAALIEELIDLGTQLFMTGTDADLFSAFDGRSQMFEVNQGRIIA